MSSEERGKEIAHTPDSNPRWRLLLLGGVLAVAVLAFLYLRGGAGGEERQELSRVCFAAMFHGQTPAALEALAKYRKVAAGLVPPEASDDLLKLEGDRYRQDYPVCNKNADTYLIDEAVFLGLTIGPALDPDAGEAGTDSERERAAVFRALAYVMRNMQSGGGTAESLALDVPPTYALRRGYGRPDQSAWLMAELLRQRGMHAAVIQLSGDTGKPYFITGVLLDRRLFLFDPYRAVPVCRARDGAVADLQSLLSGRDALAAGFGGTGTPITVEGLRKAVYLVPADPDSVLPDSALLMRILAEHGRPLCLYRSFRRDLGNLAAAVFGENPAGQMDGFTSIRVNGRDEVVALWQYPFRLHERMTEPGYLSKLTELHRGLSAVYLMAREAQLRLERDTEARQVQLGGTPDPAITQYEQILKDRAADAELVEEVTFFRATADPDPAERATRLAAYLEKYPAGRWQPLATLLAAGIEASRGDRDKAVELAEQLKPPYDLRGRLLIDAARRGHKGIAWTFPP